MDYAALRTLIETNPDHATTSDADMLVWVNEVVETRNRDTMPVSELMEVVFSFPTDYISLTADKKSALSLFAAGIDSFSLEAGTPLRTALQSIFAGTSILTELADRLTETVSRAVNAGITETISIDHITHARTY